MFKFISKRLSKYLEENNYVTKDQVVTSERLNKVRQEFQIKQQDQEEINKQLRKWLNLNDKQLEEMTTAIEELGKVTQNFAKQARASLDLEIEKLNKELVGLRKQDRVNAARIKEVSEQPANFDAFRLEMKKKMIPVQRSLEEVKEQVDDGLQTINEFKEMYNSVLKNSRKQHRKFETIIPQDQIVPKEDNKNKD